MRLFRTIIERKIIDYQRHYRAEHERTSRATAEDLVDVVDPAKPETDPCETAAQHELIDRVCREVAKLPTKERELLRLYLEERSWQEIADECGSTAAAVRLRVTRLFTRLRRKLDCHYGD